MGCASQVEFEAIANRTRFRKQIDIRTFAFTSPDSHTLLLSSASNWVG